MVRDNVDDLALHQLGQLFGGGNDWMKAQEGEGADGDDCWSTMTVDLAHDDDDCISTGSSLDEEQEPPLVDTSMDLEGQERLWALEIKQAVEASRELHNLTDMEYAQHGIIARGNLDEALGRIKGLQEFREECHINNTPDQGLFYLEEACKMQPGVLLAADICHVTGEGILAWDLGSCRPHVSFECHPHDTVLERNWKIHAGACYYLLQSVQPSLRSIREGVFCMADGHRMSWGNVCMAYQKRLHDEVWMHYPFKVKKIMDYNTNSVASIFWSLMKPLLPKSIRTVLELGCQIEGSCPNAPPRTLGELYLQLSVEESAVYLLRRAHELLSLRARNEASFRL